MTVNWAAYFSLRRRVDALANRIAALEARAKPPTMVGADGPEIIDGPVAATTEAAVTTTD